MGVGEIVFENGGFALVIVEGTMSEAMSSGCGDGSDFDNVVGSLAALLSNEAMIGI